MRLEASDQKREDRTGETKRDEPLPSRSDQPTRASRRKPHSQPNCSKPDDDTGCARSKRERRAHLHSVAALRPVSVEEDHEARAAPITKDRMALRSASAGRAGSRSERVMADPYPPALRLAMPGAVAESIAHRDVPVSCVAELATQ